MNTRNLSPIPELYVSYESAQKLKLEAGDLKSWDLTPRQICDLELLMNGGFNPLKGFLGEADYNAVVETMRLVDGQLWPMPITLDVSQEFADSLEVGQDIALRDLEGLSAGAPGAPTLADARSIACPVHLMRGGQSRASARAIVSALARALPGAALSEIPSAAHMAAATQPDLINPHIAAYLDARET